jgi:hypothetical protein
MNIKKKIRWKNNKRMKLTKKYRYRLFEEFEGEIVGTDRYFICDKNEKGKLIMGIEEKEEKEHFDHMYTNIYQWYEGNKCQIIKVFVLHQPFMKDKDYMETEGVEFETFLWKLDDKNVDERTLRIELVGDFGMIENKKYLFFDSIFESKSEKEFVR